MSSDPKTASVSGFHHVAIKAKDFDASIKFYTETLGFVETVRWGKGDGRTAMLDAGNSNCIELFAGGTDAPKPEGALLHLALQTEDVDAMTARVRAAGAEVTTEPTTVPVDSKPNPMTIRLAFFKGPDGEVLEFFKMV